MASQTDIPCTLRATQAIRRELRVAIQAERKAQELQKKQEELVKAAKKACELAACKRIALEDELEYTCTSRNEEW